jgi:hypothetical protein
MRGIFIPLAALVVTLAPGRICMPDPRVQEWVQQSQWVIRGAVTTVGASTLKEVPPSANVAGVKVDAILDGPPQFADHVGREITLLSNDPQGLTVGKPTIFFTRSWLFGDSLAVREVGRIEAGDPRVMQDDIAAARQNVLDRQLAGRLAKADLVVSGVVLRTAPAGVDQRRVRTEHEPDWWQADIRVEARIKGAVASPTLTILFPNSQDELWMDSPKFKEGQEGIWILQRDQQEKGWPVLRVPGLTALDPLDFQPLRELERVRKLVG